MTLFDVGEIGLLDELERSGLVTGIENDAALLDGGLIVTQDALVQDSHFRLDWTSWRDLGYKAAAVNLSDLAASGAEPDCLVVSLGLPGETKVASVLELYEGFREAKVPVVGGDTTSASRVFLSVTAIGRSARVPGRAGAEPGDVLVVTGPLGASAAGFFSLAAGLDNPLVAAHRRPPIRLAEGKALASRAKAMLDLSDGLATDVCHIARRSGCRITIDLEQVPVAEGVAAVARRVRRSVWDLACGFGEDYELLAALPRADAEAGGYSIVGECSEGSDVRFRLAGNPVELGGWDHFRGSSQGLHSRS